VANDLQVETIGALSWYFDKHNLKVQADVGSIHTQTATGPTDEKQYRVQAQITF
jgi:phosphate-selective porin OprO/OprP